MWSTEASPTTRRIQSPPSVLVHKDTLQGHPRVHEVGTQGPHLHTGLQGSVNRAFHLQAFPISPSWSSFHTLFLFPLCSSYKIHPPSEVNMELRGIVLRKQSLDSKTDMAGWGAQVWDRVMAEGEGWEFGDDTVWHLWCWKPCWANSLIGEGSLLFVEENWPLLSWDMKASLLQWWGQWWISTWVYFCQILIWRSNSDEAERRGEN